MKLIPEVTSVAHVFNWRGEERRVKSTSDKYPAFSKERKRFGESPMKAGLLFTAKLRPGVGYFPTGADLA